MIVKIVEAQVCSRSSPRGSWDSRGAVGDAKHSPPIPPPRSLGRSNLSPGSKADFWVVELDKKKSLVPMRELL